MIKGSSMQPFSVSNFKKSFVIECGSRQSLSFLYFYHFVEAKGGRNLSHFPFLPLYGSKRLLEAAPSIPTFLSICGSKEWFEAAPSISPFKLFGL
jgi:hypothetical protein